MRRFVLLKIAETYVRCRKISKGCYPILSIFLGRLKRKIITKNQL